MSKYDLITQLMGQIPSVVSTYFGMIGSGDQNAVIGGLLGLVGLGYIVFKLIRRFWVRLLLGNI